LRIDGLAEVPLWRPSPTHGSKSTPPFTSRSGGSMFTTPPRPVADRTGVADEQDAVLVDRQLGVVDTVVIVLRPLEHDRGALEGALVALAL
jgi:hypothetical protein